MRALRGGLIAAALAIGLIAAPSAGATTYAPAGTFAEGEHVLGQPAVDQSSGNVYVGELLGPEFKLGEGALLRFDPSGKALSPASMGQPDAYLGTAVSEAAGHPVYAATGTFAIEGSQSILGFDGAGSALGLPFPFPLASVGSSFGSTIAVSASGNILATGFEEIPGESYGFVVEYSAKDGEELQTIECTSCPAPADFGSINSVAVDSAGNVYVADSGRGRVIKLGPEGDSDPTAPTVFSTGGSSYVAVNPANDHVFVSGTDAAVAHITEYDPAGAVVSDFGSGELAEAPIIAVSALSGVVYTSEVTKAGIFAPVGPPQATTDPASALSTTAATMNGTANPHSSGAITSCEFEWGTNTSYTETPVPCNENPADGFNNVAVNGALSGLAPNTTYHYRLAVESAGGEDTGEDATFTTLPNKPLATTEAASAITQTAATLNGKVDAEGDNADCLFEYGTSTAYGKTAPCSPPTAEGTNATAVSAALSGLSAATTYHYRVVATNKGGTTNGNDMTLTTLADTCQTNAALCPPPPVSGSNSTPPPTTASPPPPAKKPLKCKKGFKRKTVKGKQKCVKVKKKHKKR